MNKRTIFLFALVAIPSIAFAQSGGLVSCGKTEIGADGTPYISNPCDYADFVATLQNILNFLIYTLATPIATLLIAISGFKMVTSGGDPSAYKKAKTVLKNTMIGYVIMLSAFLVIKLIITFLFGEDFSLFG